MEILNVLYSFMYDLFLCEQEGDKLIRLWIHEVYRVFYDRLIDNEDRETFFNIVKERTSGYFKQSMDKVSSTLHFLYIHSSSLLDDHCLSKIYHVSSVRLLR